ncbi:hypothetical protein ANCCAN_23348 [Ancylostoma caninum]|uniref:Uncharacterized protein n=1 Tax=Ancylostoma caninum TaxID=29170 RepID=A0A368FJ36_ANCCA|nr:hypothetical protein ANCCAN_23348 [Ancylostoma caninum]
MKGSTPQTSTITTSTGSASSSSPSTQASTPVQLSTAILPTTHPSRGEPNYITQNIAEICVIIRNSAKYGENTK